MTDSRSQHGWRKSSYSTQVNNCVEVRHDARGVAVRDTKNRAGGTVEFTPTQWRTFLAQVATAR